MRTGTAEVPYQTSVKGHLYPGSVFLQAPVHHYHEDFTTKSYKKFDKGTALLHTVYAGAGYKLQREVQGAINLNLGEEPLLPGLTEVQGDNHIIGVIFAHQYTLKKEIK